MTAFASEVTSNCRRGFSLLLLVAILLATPAMVLGQSYFGTVSGILTDPSAAIIQGAKVTLVDEEKGYHFTATSDSSGRYLFVSIPPGMYSVTAEMQGFEKTVRTHIKLNVTENATANLTLKVASATQSVEVRAQAQTIATEDAVTGEVIDRRAINDLPLVDRYALDLTYLTPGVTDASDANHVGDTGTNFVSNGSRNASADILMDGSSITNFEPNGGITNVTYTPSPESIEEFKVQQSNFSAEYGFSGGSVVNMITRSGTNRFHGEAYDFIRNTITDANNWFASGSIPPVHRHDFGGTLGGPIIKNKTFFFFDWEGTISSGMSVYTAGVPSAAERTGDFGEVCAFYSGSFDANGNCSNPEGQIYDPYSGVYGVDSGGAAGAIRGTPIPYNNIGTYISPGSPNPNLPSQYQPTAGKQGNLLDPVAQNMMNLFPNPMTNVPNESIYKNWIASGATPSNSEQYDLKIDHRFSEKNLLSAKYSQGWGSSTPYNCFKTFIDPCGSGINGGNSHLFALNDTYTIRPTLLMTITLGFTRGTEKINAYNSSLNSNPLNALGFPQPTQTYLESNGFNGVPAMFIGGGYYSAGYTSAGNDPYGNYRQGQDTGQLSAMVSKIHGAHELKFGFEGRLHQQNYIQTNAPLGIFNFNDVGSSSGPQGLAGNEGGDGMASFLMGQMEGNGNSYYEIQFRVASENYQYAWFAQDNWKATSKLTLNLGLRYDVSLPRTERHNRMNWFDPTVTSPLNGGTISYPDPLTGQNVTRPLLGGEVFTNSSVRTNWLTDWKDIQPRFGFAYQIMPKTVIRGGYGIYYSQTRSGANGLLSYGSQGFNQYTSVISTYQNDGATPWLHLSNPYPFTPPLIQPSGSSLGLMNDVGYGAIGPLRTSAAARTPYEESWTFGFERQMPWSVVFGGSYIGKKGTHLYLAGGNNYDTLGASVESLPNPPVDPNNPCPTPMANIPCLTSYVTNPFSSVNGGPISDPNSTLSSPTVQAVQLELPYPEFTGVTTDEPPTASSIYHALQLTAEKHYSNGLELLASYTWSKSIDTSSMYDTNVAWLSNYGSNSGWALTDPNKPWLERGLSTFDVPSMLKFSYSYDLPFGRGRAFLSGIPRALDLVIGGWKTNGIWEIHSGRPLSFFTFNGGVPLPTYGPQWPNLAGKVERTHGSDSNWVNNYFSNPQVIQVPLPYTLGNAGRTTGYIRTPRSFTSDLSIAKQFLLSNVHDGVHLEMRFEAKNAFNHPVFGTPDTYAGDPNIGTINYLAVGPREGQLALKLTF
ncbi:MAG: carboxypeptidase regulatory-like domain-containing protein [Terriglobales bacterium]